MGLGFFNSDSYRSLCCSSFREPHDLMAWNNDCKTNVSLSKIDCSDDVLNFVLFLCHRIVIYNNPPMHRHIARPPEGVVMPEKVGTLFQYHPHTAGKQFHLCYDERVVLCTQAGCAECTKTFLGEPIWVLCKITEYIRRWCDSPSTVAWRQRAKTPHPRKVWLGSSEIERL